MAADLISLLRLRTTVIGIKMFATGRGDGGDPENPAAVRGGIPPTRSSAWPHGSAGPSHHRRRLVGAQCRAVIGLAPQDEKFLEGKNYVGVWHGTAEDARLRQEALDVVPYGQYQAMAVSPLNQRPAQSA